MLTQTFDALSTEFVLANTTTGIFETLFVDKLAAFRVSPCHLTHAVNRVIQTPPLLSAYRRHPPLPRVTTLFSFTQRYLLLSGRRRLHPSSLTSDCSLTRAIHTQLIPTNENHTLLSISLLFPSTDSCAYITDDFAFRFFDSHRCCFTTYSGPNYPTTIGHHYNHLLISSQDSVSPKV